MLQFRDKKQIENRKKIIRNIIVFVLFFILFISGIVNWSGKMFNYIGNPIWKSKIFVLESINNISYLFNKKSILFNENKKLIQENLDIKLSMIDYQVLKKENEELKGIIGRILSPDHFVLGNILTKPNNSPYDTLIIDLGLDNNIKEGDMVYANGNIPIGYISKIYNKNSLVILYTNPGEKTEGFIEGSNGSVELIGRGGGNFEMIIPVELILAKGDIIFLPDENSKVLALVGETISKKTDPFRKVILSSPVNVQNLKWVQVEID